MTLPRRLPLPFALVLTALAALLAPAALAQDAPRETVVVTRIEGPLAESMLTTLERAIRRAEEAQASFLVVEIDTPGGEVTLMERLGRALQRTRVVPVAYVAHEAVSAGAYLALACERIYTSEHAQIGSSYPIVVAPFGMADGITDENVREKHLSYLRSKFRDMASGHERPGIEALAEAMVDPSLEVLLVQQGADEVPMTRQEYEDLQRSGAAGTLRVIRTIVPAGKLLNLTAREAFDLGFSDGVVASRDELLQALAVAGDAEVVFVGPSWSERFVALLEHVQWLLLIAGLVLLYVEMKVPGFGLPGALGVICLGLVFFRNWLVGLAEIPEILVVLFGIVLVAIELLVIPGFGFVGITGLVAIVLGLVFSFLPFLLPEGPYEAEHLGDVIGNFSASLIVSLIGVFLLSRFVLPRTPFYRRLVLDTGDSTATLRGSAVAWSAAAPVAAGDRGLAATDLRPAGRVDVDGRPFDAVSEGDYLRRGEPIEIVRVEGNRVVVRAAPRL